MLESGAATPNWGAISWAEDGESQMSAEERAKIQAAKNRRRSLAVNHDASTQCNFPPEKEADTLVELHRSVLLFYHLMQRYIEDNEFPFVDEWIGSVPDDYVDPPEVNPEGLTRKERRDRFKQQEEQYIQGLRAQLQELVNQPLKEGDDGRSVEQRKIEMLNDIANKQRTIFARRVRRAKEEAESERDTRHAFFVAQNRKAIENPQAEYLLGLHDDATLDSVKALLGKTFLFLRNAIHKERVPRPENILWGGEKQKSLFGLCEGQDLEDIAWPRDCDSIFETIEDLERRARELQDWYDDQQKEHSRQPTKLNFAALRAAQRHNISPEEAEMISGRSTPQGALGRRSSINSLRSEGIVSPPQGTVHAPKAKQSPGSGSKEPSILGSARKSSTPGSTTISRTTSNVKQRARAATLATSKPASGKTTPNVGKANSNSSSVNATPRIGSAGRPNPKAGGGRLSRKSSMTSLHSEGSTPEGTPRSAPSPPPAAAKKSEEVKKPTVNSSSIHKKPSAKTAEPPARASSYPVLPQRETLTAPTPDDQRASSEGLGSFDKLVNIESPSSPAILAEHVPLSPKKPLDPIPRVAPEVDTGHKVLTTPPSGEVGKSSMSTSSEVPSVASPASLMSPSKQPNRMLNTNDQELEATPFTGEELSPHRQASVTSPPFASTTESSGTWRKSSSSTGKKFGVSPRYAGRPGSFSSSSMREGVRIYRQHEGCGLPDDNVRAATISLSHGARGK